MADGLQTMTIPPRNGTCAACRFYDSEAGDLIECPEKYTGGATGRLANMTTAYSRPCQNFRPVADIPQGREE